MRALYAVLFIAFAAPAAARLTPAEIGASGAAPAAGARLPSLARFVDQDARPLRPGPERLPTVLLFADYSCAHLCGPGVTLTAGALHDAGLAAGRDYRMIVIGLDGDGPAAARRLRDTRLIGLPREAAAMRLLSGPPAAIAAAERALGYHAVYDAQADQFAHDAAIFLFSPAGDLDAVLPETATTPVRMADALVHAARGERYAPPATGTIRDFVALCYGLAAAHGIYGPAIVVALRIAGFATIALIGFAIWRLGRRRARC